MKPCLAHRQTLALLAAGQLEAGAVAALRAHTRHCPGCRDYLAQISTLCTRLEHSAHALPPVENEEVFHQALAARLASESKPSLETDEGPTLWSTLFAPAWKLAVWGAVAGVLFLGLNRPVTTPIQTAMLPVAAVVAAPSDNAPSLWAYQRAVGESWENFQSLLASDAARASVAEPGVTAFARDLRGLAD